MKKFILALTLSLLFSIAGFTQSAAYLTTSSEPWGQNGIIEAFNAVYGSQGSGWIKYLYGTSASTIFTSDRKLVFIEGGNTNTTVMKDFLNANWDAINAWVSLGNSLIVDAATNEDLGTFEIGRSGVRSNRILTFTMNAYINSGTYPAPNYCHPLLTNATYPAYYSGDYTGNYVAHNVITGSYTSSVFTCSGGNTMVEKTIGTGRMIVSGCTLPWYTPTNGGWTPATQMQNLLRSMLSWAKDLSSGPTLTTTGISNNSTTSATSGGNVTADGGKTVTSRGIVWNTSGSPTISSYTGITSDGSGTGTYTSSLTNLSPNTTYYVKAYATNSIGTSYGSQVSFTTYPTDPTSPIASPPTICRGNSSQLTVSSPQGNVYWYTSGCGNTYVGAGNPLTVYPTDNTTYYARNYNGNYSAGCVSTTITVNQPASLPASATVVVPSGVLGQTSANLSWTTSTGMSPITYYWAVGTSSGVTYESGYTVRGTSTTFPVTATGLSKSTTYYLAVKAVNSCGTSAYQTSSSFRTNHELIYTAGTNGTIGTTPSGGSSSITQTISNNGNGTAVYAVPNANYHFVNWSDGLTTNPRTDISVTNSFSVTANFAINRLEFSVQPTNTIAGDNIIFTVRIRDVYGNTMTNSDQDVTIDIGTNPVGGTLSGTKVLHITNGVASSALVWVNKVGNGYTLTASSSPLTGATSGSFNITPAAIDHFTVIGITDPVMAGTTTTPVVTAYDQYNNIKTNYTGTIVFSSSETHHAEEIYPANYTFVQTDNGTKTFINGVTLKTTGERSVTVTGDTKTGSQTAITVTPAPIHYFTLAANGTITAGTPFTVTATVYDEYGNVKTNYDGSNSVMWTSTATSSFNGTARIIPANGDQTFNAGVATIGGFTFFNSHETPTITITDGPSAVPGTTAPIIVHNAPLDNFKVVAGTSQMANIPFDVTVTARDVYWNTCIDYAGNIRFKSSDDGLVIFPPNLQSFAPASTYHGVRTFTNGAEINTIGAYWLRTADEHYAYKSGEQQNIVVEPGAFSPLALKSTLTIDYDTRIAGEYVNVILTPRDVQGNLLYSCRDISVLLNGSASDYDGGIGVMNVGDGTYTARVRVTLTGNNIISAKFNETHQLFDQTRTVLVSPAPVNLAHTLITASPSTMTTDEVSQITVQLKDAFDNNRTTSDGKVSLETNHGVFTGGVTDNNNGTYSATLHGNYRAVGIAHIIGNFAGNAQNQDINGTITDTEDVTINEGAPSLANIEITASPEEITTNGTSTISVQLKDQFGNLITTDRGTIALTTTPNGSLSPVNYTTGGIYTSTLSGFNPGNGTTTIRGTYNGGTIIDTAFVTFHEGLPDLAHITITASPATMTTDQSSTITVQLKDVYGNNLNSSRGTVTLSSTIGALSSVTDNNNGTYTATLTGDNRGFGDATITGSLSGFGQIADNAVVTITQGKPDLAKIDISPESASMTTDETRLITIQLKDQFGNNLTTSRGTITLSNSLNGAALTVVNDHANGTYTATLSTTVTGTATITGSLTDVADGINGAITDDAVVLINEGKPALAQIQITASPETITTDETSTITIQLKDQWGNNLSTQRGTIALSSDKGSVSAAATYQNNGYYTATLTGDTRNVGLATITGVLTDTDDGVSGTITDNAQVTIEEGLPSLAVSDISVNNATMTTDGSSIVTIQLKDQFGNLITHDRGTVSLTATIGALTSVSYNAAGIYTATLTGDNGGTNGTGISYITGSFIGTGTASSVNGNFSDGATVTIGEGLPALATTTITADPITMTTDEHSTISVQLKDQFGNNIVNNRSTVGLSTNSGVLTGVTYTNNGIYTATLSGDNTGTGTATITGTLGGDVAGQITNNATVTITEGAPSLVTSTIIPSVSSITTDETSTITVQLKDQFGNYLTSSRGTITLSTTLGALTVVSDNGNGTYTATLSGNNTGVGTATITGALNSSALSQSATVSITEGLPNLTQSTITASTSSITTDETSIITVQLKDQWGNAIINSRGTVTLATTLGILTSVTDHNNGTYTATLSANNTGTGTATITGILTGSVTGAFVNPIDITITEGLPNLSQIEITAGPTSITADQTSTITIQLKDQYGNNLTQSRGTINLFTSPIGHLSNVTDNNNGSYTATFSLTAYGTGLATITGTFTGSETATTVHGTVIDNATIQVSPGASTKLTVLTQPSSTATAGVVFAQQPVVRIEDQFGNLVTSDNTTVLTAARATGTDVLKGTLTATVTNGIATFAGLYYTKAELITLGFTSIPELNTANSTSILVGHAPIASFSLNSPADFIAGATRAAYTVTRYDAYNNLVTTGSQVAYLYSSSTGANKKFYNAASSGSVITQLTIANGASTANFWYYDEKTGNHTITASDNATAPDGATGIVDGTDQITVTPALLKDFIVYNVQDPHDLGTWQSVTVEPRDIYDNRKTNYVGSVTFSNTDVNATNPTDYQFTLADAGVHTFNNAVLFSQPGNWWLTALDLAEPKKYGAQPDITVQRAVSIAANNRNKTYGDILSLGTSEFTIAGIVPGVNPVAGEITGVTLTSDGSAATATVAGSPYVITPSAATFASGVNPDFYRIEYSNTGRLTVSQRALALSNFTASNKMYDGTTNVTGTGFSDNRVNSDVLTFDYTTAFTTKHAGTGKQVDYTGITISGGSGAGNYTLPNSTGSATADIFKRPINVTAHLASKVYDGNLTSNVAPDVQTSEIQTGDAVTTPGIQTYATAFIGTGINLTPSGTVINDDNNGNNYAINYVPQNTGEITQKAVTVYAVIDSKTYDGTVSSLEPPTFDVGQLASGDTVLTAAIQVYDNEYVGTTHTMTASGLTIKNGNNIDVTSNYHITYVPFNSGIITQMPVTVTAALPASKTYDGNLTSSGNPTVGLLAVDDVVDIAPIQTYDNKNVGNTHVLTASGLTIKHGTTDVTANYNISYPASDATGVINQKEVNVYAVTDTKTYDGTITSDKTPSFAEGQLVLDDVVNNAPTQTYDTKLVATSKVMTPAGLTIKDALDADMTANYNIHYLTDATGVISQRDINVTAATDTKTYDGNTTSNGVPIVATASLASGDVVNNAPTQTYDTKLVATSKVMTPAGLTIKDALDADMTANYNIHYLTDATGVISQRDINVTAATDTKTYDGNTTSNGVPIVATASLASGDVVNNAPTQTYDTKLVATSKVMTPAGLTIKDALDADMTANYNIHYLTDATGVISQRDINVTAATDTKTYDGNTTSNGVPIVATASLASGDVVNNAPTQTYDTKLVATSKVMTPAGLTIKDALDADMTANYNIHYLTDATGVISQKAVNVYAVTDTKTYDGTVISYASPTFDIEQLASGDAVNIAPIQVYDNRNFGTTHVLNASDLTIKDGSNADMTGNYNIVYSPSVNTGVINKATVTVTAQTDTKVYDRTTNSLVPPVITGIIAPDVASTSPTQTFDNWNVGIGKTLSANGLVISDDNNGNNYAINYVTNTTGVITPLNITGNFTVDATKVYDGGTLANVLTRTLNGVISPDDVNLSGGTANYNNKNVGTGKTVTLSGMSLAGAQKDNYSLTSVATTTANITVRTLALTNFGADSKEYDGTTVATGIGFTDNRVPNDNLSFGRDAAFRDPSVGEDKPVDYTNIRISGGADKNNYVLASTIGTAYADITPRNISIIANNKSKIYGETITGGTNSTAFSVVGLPLANGETISTVTITYGNGAAATNNAGTYMNQVIPSDAVGINGFVAGNYIVTYINGNIIVGKADLAVTAIASNITYGGSEPSVSVTYGSFQNGETSSVLDNVDFSLGTNYTQWDAAGTYLTTITAGTATDNNYNFTPLNTSTFEVGKADLTITANNVNKTYGTAISGGSGSTAFSSTGLLNGQTIGSVTIDYGTGAAATANAATYTAQVIPSDAVGGTFAEGNYNITYAKGDIIVGKADLAVTAIASNITYGGSEPSVSVTYGSFQNGETSSVLDNVDFSLGTNYTQWDAAGTYLTTITAGTATDNNYNFTPLNTSTFEVGKADLTITANNVNKTYGTAISGGSGSTAFSSTGLLNGQTIGSVTIDYGTGAAATANAATYTAQVIPSDAVGGTFAEGNYNITYAKGDIIVGKADLAVTAIASNITYGGSEPSVSVTYGSFQNGETSSVLDNVDFSLGTNYTQWDAAGTYLTTITAGTATDNNYNFTPLNTSTFEVGKANAVIAVTPYNVAYDGVEHTATFTAVGVETTPADLTGLMAVSGTTHTDGGTYNSDVWTFAGNTNYNTTSGTITDAISKIDATIAVNGFSGTYDGAAHGASGTATGLNSLNLGSLLHVDATTYTNVPGGSVAWTFDGNDNYNATSGNATVTINKANAVIAVTPYNVAYDGVEHTATFTAVGVETTPADLTGLMAVSGTTHTDGGTYNSDVWTFAGNTNYNTTSGTITDAISKIDATIAVNGFSGTYDGAAHGASGTATGLNSLNLGSLLHVDATTYTNVPGGSVAWTFDGNDNYNATSGNATVTINKANAVIAVTPYNVAYDGVEHTATFTAVGVETTPADLTGLMAVSGTTHTDGGTYNSDVWTFAGNTNYNTTSGTITDAISKIDATIAVNGFSGTYDGAAHGASGTATGLNSLNLGSLLHVDATTYTNVPGGSVAWTFDGNDNYNATSGNATVTINKANAVIAVTPYNVAYDGVEHTATFTAVGVETTPADLTGLMAVSGTTHTDGGTYNSDVWTFAGNTNYNTTSGTITDAISKIDATIAVNGFSGTYDGAAHGASGTATGLNSLNLGSLLHVDATTYTNVPGGSVAWTFDGNDNYNATSGNATVTINKANAVIAVTPYNVAYDGVEHTATFTAVGVETTPADLTGLMAVSGTTHTDGGTYNSDVWTFAGNTNYNTTSGTITDAISKIDATIAVNGFSGTYDGAAHGASGTATGLNSLNLGSLLHVDATSYTNVPGGSVAWTFNGNDNYNATSGNATVTINKANLAITANNITKDYGVVYTFLGTEFTYSGLIVGESISSVTLTSDGAPALANPGTYPIVASNAVGGGNTLMTNYNISYAPGTMTINGNVNLGGYVLYDKYNATDLPMSGVTVTIKDANGVQLATAVTNASGYYQLQNVPVAAASNSNAKIEVSTTAPWGGVNATDALAIQLRSVNNAPAYWLPLTFIDHVADVSTGGDINAQDVLQVKARVLYPSDPTYYFPAGDWTFYADNRVFTNTAGSNAYLLNPMANGQLQTITARTYGDVNGSYTLPAVKSDELIPIETGETQYVEAGKSFELPVRLEEGIDFSAMTLLLHYDNTKVQIEGLTSEIPGLQYVIENDQVRAVWSRIEPVSFSNGDSFVTLQMHTIAPVNSNDDVLFMQSLTEFADNAANVIPNVVLATNKIENVVSGTGELNKTSFTLDAYPNPFVDKVVLKYSLSEPANVKISLIDMTNRPVADLIESKLQAGDYSYEYKAANNLNSGVYFVKVYVEGKNNTFTKLLKLVYVR